MSGSHDPAKRARADESPRRCADGGVRALSTGIVELDVGTFEILRHRLTTINDAQATVLARTSGSPAAYEAKDYNTSILTGPGQTIFLGALTPRLSMAIDFFVEAVIASGNASMANPGDMFYSNDPWAGASHQHDGALVAPLFHDGEIVFWTGVAVHDPDMGAPTPGVSGTASDAHQEAPIIPPVKLVERGHLRPDLENWLVRNVREPNVTRLSVRARMAALSSTLRRLEDTITQFGRAEVVAFQERWIAYVEEALRTRLRELPDGVWREEVYIDDDGQAADRLYRVAVMVEKRGESLVIDFRGTDPCAPGPLNCAYGGLMSATYCAVLTALCYDFGWCPAALRRVVAVHTDENTVTNAAYPGAVGHATTQAMGATDSIVRACLSKMMACSARYRHRAQASDSMASTGAVLFAEGEDHRIGLTNCSFLVARGSGAYADRDGVDTGGDVSTPGLSVLNVERAEHGNPLVLILSRRQHPASAGPGATRGGTGMETAVAKRDLLDGSRLRFTWGGMGFHHPQPKGLFGGMWPSVAGTVVVHNVGSVGELVAGGHVPYDWSDAAADRITRVRAKSAPQELQAGDLLIFWADGGGGFGDPRTRPVEAVLRDLDRGLCTEKIARDIYGVALADGALDEVATARLRRTPSFDREQGSEKRTSPAHELDASWEILGAVGNAFDIARDTRHGELMYACHRCGHRYGNDAASMKLGATLRSVKPTDLTYLNRFAFAHGDVELRTYECPSCGLRTGTEVRRPREPRIVDCAPVTTPPDSNKRRQ